MLSGKTYIPPKLHNLQLYKIYPNCQKDMLAFCDGIHSDTATMLQLNELLSAPLLVWGLIYL